MPGMVMSTLGMIAALSTLIMLVRLMRLGVWGMERERFREINRRPLVRLFTILTVVAATIGLICGTAAVLRYEALARYSTSALLLSSMFLLAYLASLEVTARGRRSDNDPGLS